MEGLTVEEALEQILSRITVVSEAEKVSLLEARGRILACDLCAEMDNPPFDRSPIDGYACRSADIQGASEESPAVLRVIGELDAGQAPCLSVREGEAVRIMTGAVIPSGCDCCVRQESTDYGETLVRITAAERAWSNYCFRGEDVRKGTVLLREGAKLGFVEAGVLASMGFSAVPVYRRPRVAVLVTGDEVIEPGRPLTPGKIYDSNRAFLCARLLDFGVELTMAETIEDDAAAMGDALKRAVSGADLVLTTGAVSVGKKDIMHEALGGIGAEQVFWRVKVKPGMPTLFSVYQGTPVISLSGNPFGVAVIAELLVRPAIAKLAHDSSLALRRVSGVMADPFPKASHGRRFVRAFWDGERFHLPDGLHSNGALASMMGCNCLIDVRPGSPALREGVSAEAILL